MPQTQQAQHTPAHDLADRILKVGMGRFEVGNKETWKSAIGRCAGYIDDHAAAKMAEVTRERDGLAIQCDTHTKLGQAREKTLARVVGQREELLAAAVDIKMEVEQEVEQRQTSGNDEYWQPLKEKLDRLTAAIARATNQKELAAGNGAAVGA